MYLPLSIVGPDDKLRTSKALLLHKWKSILPAFDSIHADYIFIANDMTHIREITVNNLTCKQFAAKLLESLNVIAKL